MKYKTECVTNAGNGKWNEDRLFIKDNLIGVIDGATPIHNFSYNGYSTIAEWMVDSFTKNITTIPQDAYIDYKLICREIIDKLGNESYIKELASYDKPCFTSATVSFARQTLLCQVIGDSYVYVQKKNGDIICHTDSRVDFYAAKTVNSVIHAKIEKGDIPSTIEKQKIENRSWMNVKGGYWVVGFEGNFENEFIEVTYGREEVSNIFICTDGFARLMNEFELIEIADLINRKISLNEAIKLLRYYEERNSDKENFPCVKKSDDATAVMISFDI